MMREKSLNMPGVLVVIATLGERTALLRKTLDSITAQNVDNIDIVLVYPLKSIETNRLAEEFNANSIDDPGSMSAAVNVGIQSAREKHKYVTWIGDDDILLPDSLHSTVAALEQDSNASAAFGYCKYINENGEYLLTSKAGKLAPWLMTWGPNLVPLPGTLFRLSSLKKLDYIFDESLRYAMDLDLFIRLRKTGRLVGVQKPVSAFRWHSTSATVSNRKASLEEAELVKRRYMNRFATFIAPVWEIPVRIATHAAANRVTNLAKSRSDNKV
jgi:glycosyltransferase involved in cell wall biosynthesis